MSTLSRQLNNTINHILYTDDRDGMLELYALDQNVDEGLWERFVGSKQNLLEEGEWPEVEWGEDNEITVREGDEVVCTASIGQRQDMGHPRQRSPSFSPEPKFEDECSQAHKRAVEIEWHKRNSPY